MMRNYFGALIGVVFMIIIAFVAFRIAQFVYLGLLYLLPIFIIVTFIIDRKVVINHFKSLFGVLPGQHSDLFRLILGILILPMMGPVLLAKSLFFKKLTANQKEFMNQANQQGNDTSRNIGEQYIDFEDLTNEINKAHLSEKWMENNDKSEKIW